MLALCLLKHSVWRQRRVCAQEAGFGVSGALLLPQCGVTKRRVYVCPQTGLASCTCFCYYAKQWNMSEEVHRIKAKPFASNK